MRHYDVCPTCGDAHPQAYTIDPEEEFTSLAHNLKRNLDDAITDTDGWRNERRFKDIKWAFDDHLYGGNTDYYLVEGSKHSSHRVEPQLLCNLEIKYGTADPTFTQAAALQNSIDNGLPAYVIRLNNLIEKPLSEHRFTVEEVLGTEINKEDSQLYTREVGRDLTWHDYIGLEKSWRDDLNQDAGHNFWRKSSP